MANGFDTDYWDAGLVSDQLRFQLKPLGVIDNSQYIRGHRKTIMRHYFETCLVLVTFKDSDPIAFYRGEPVWMTGQAVLDWAKFNGLGWIDTGDLLGFDTKVLKTTTDAEKVLVEMHFREYE